jgi:hypothetical protein
LGKDIAMTMRALLIPIGLILCTVGCTPVVGERVGLLAPNEEALILLFSSGMPCHELEGFAGLRSVIWGGEPGKGGIIQATPFGTYLSDQPAWIARTQSPVICLWADLHDLESSDLYLYALTRRMEAICLDPETGKVLAKVDDIRRPLGAYVGAMLGIRRERGEVFQRWMATEATFIDASTFGVDPTSMTAGAFAAELRDAPFDTWFITELRIASASEVEVGNWRCLLRLRRAGDSWRVTRGMLVCRRQ